MESRGKKRRNKSRNLKTAANNEEIAALVTTFSCDATDYYQSRGVCCSFIKGNSPGSKQLYGSTTQAAPVVHFLQDARTVRNHSE